MDSVIQFRGTIYEKGFGQIASSVMRDRTLPKQSRLIYAYMCSFASYSGDGKRSAFPSISLQCAELDMNEDTYFKWRKELIKRGLITIEKRKERNKFERNLYFIEAVPIPRNIPEAVPNIPEEASEKGKIPLNQHSEPYPNFSGTKISGTKKSGTNNISSNNISFINTNNTYKDKLDDDKRKVLRHNEEEINLIISYLRESTKDELSERSFKSVLKKVMDKYSQGEVSSFRDYLVTALINKIEALEIRRMKEQGKELSRFLKPNREKELRENEIHRDIPIYNWLEA